MVDIKEFSKKKPYLYHLTATENVTHIISSGKLLSTNLIALDSELKDPQSFLRQRRANHVVISGRHGNIHVRDQRPISIKALSKCLTNGLKVEDYCEILNMRVFMWPTLNRLERHFERYKHEKPSIFRFNTYDLLSLNPHVEFSHLNSGATRANSYLGGIAPKRGHETFCLASKFSKTISAIAEVTFIKECILPKNFEISESPNGAWKKQNIK